MAAANILPQNPHERTDMPKKATSEKRSIPRKTELLLWVRAGGRCEFDGCNEYLIAHHVTQRKGKYGEVAHIVAFSDAGPRGDAERPSEIHEVDNLMLLCHRCHVLIDRERPDDFPVDVLRKHKIEHEERILRLTEAKPDRKTTVLQLRARVNGQIVTIPPADVWDAVAPRYPADSQGVVIDLTALDDAAPGYYALASQTIERRLATIYDAGMAGEAVSHISLFALAPMPLLIYCGTQLSNKVPVDFYQRHRDTQNWTWKNDGSVADYIIKKHSAGADVGKVALLLSLSGAIDQSRLPDEIDSDYSIYEVTVDGAPDPTFLGRRESLERFRLVYHEAMARILATHGQIRELALFPAVPAPIAVACGYELLSKVYPSLKIYDNDKRSSGWRHIMNVS